MAPITTYVHTEALSPLTLDHIFSRASVRSPLSWSTPQRSITLLSGYITGFRHTAVASGPKK